MNEEIEGYDETAPVLIVGGSLVGLSTSLFLSWHGIPSILVERHSDISPHPRAFNFNMRTMEIFRSVGAEEAIRQAQPPAFQSSGILQAESLVGKELNWITQNTTGSDLSPVLGSIIGQDVLEPILHARAKELGGDLRFYTELVSFEQDAEGVDAVIRDRGTGVERRIRARYLVAADGHKSTIRKQLGVKVHGPGTLGHQLSILFSADIEGPLRGRSLAVCFVNNPTVRRGTSLVFARNGLSFALFTPYSPEKGESVEDFSGETGIELVRGAVGVPDLSVEIINIRPWEVAAWAAGNFQQENVFLVGDAAHITPPAGAFGANTGIADAYNLAWKLAFTVKGEADAALLSTYTTERQPVVRFTVEQSLAMFMNFSSFASGKPPIPTVNYDAIAFGYRYHDLSSAEDQDQEQYEDPHHPTGLPGTHASHVILRRHKEEFSTLDLFGKNIVLLIGAEGEAWQKVARDVAEQLKLPLDVYSIGSQGDFVDVHDRFLEIYGIKANGAVLVRPDGFIAWRAEQADAHPAYALEQALTHMLGRSS